MKLLGGFPLGSGEDLGVERQHVLQREVEDVALAGLAHPMRRRALLSPAGEDPWLSCRSRIWRASRFSATTRRPTSRISSRTLLTGTTRSSPESSSSTTTDVPLTYPSPSRDLGSEITLLFPTRRIFTMSIEGSIYTGISERSTAPQTPSPGRTVVSLRRAGQWIPDRPDVQEALRQRVPSALV